MARASRPPGFDMTYRPAEEFFGPPLVVRLPSFLHAAVSVFVIALVFIVERRPHSALYVYMYQREHLIDAHLLALAFGISGLSSVLRSGMRGVRVRSNSVEYRDVVGSLWPKVKKLRWAQIDQISFEQSGNILVNLWDGSQELLPVVRDQEGLERALQRLALARAIPLLGGKQLDDLEELQDGPESGVE